MTPDELDDMEMGLRPTMRRLGLAREAHTLVTNARDILRNAETIGVREDGHEFYHEQPALESIETTLTALAELVDGLAERRHMDLAEGTT